MKLSRLAFLAQAFSAATVYSQSLTRVIPNWLISTGIPTGIIPSFVTRTQDSSASPSVTACPGNAPNKRAVWCNYSIDTDYENVVPDTGKTLEYWFDIDEVTISPDGFARPVMAVNGTIPGPTLYANWGDYVVIHVTSHLERARNGSSIHWHGMRQNYTNQNDGVVSTMTYRWRAVQYGSSWYHSHIGLQAWEGVFGGIVINGPATANYDIDKGSLFLNDWTHATVDELYEFQHQNGPITLDNGLLNGTNVLGTGANSTKGSRFTMKMNQGTSYRLRLVNAAIDTHWSFMIDNHSLTVIAMDLVPIKPFTTDILRIGMGQRYDIIVEANQASIAENFWIRAIPGASCALNYEATNIEGILYYGSAPQTPNTVGYTLTSSDTDCLDMSMTDLVPYLAKDVAAPVWNKPENVSLNHLTGPFFWEMNSTSMKISWENPTLGQIYNNKMNFTASSGVIELPFEDEWVYLMIKTTLPVTHPIHLHGHDFSILAQELALTMDQS
ncbi:CAZyme family AA1 [Penicillium atrosanguineum]|nr:CAZyme family AA1 [Penicillium atrosanguineum]